MGHKAKPTKSLKSALRRNLFWKCRRHTFLILCVGRPYQLGNEVVLNYLEN